MHVCIFSYSRSRVNRVVTTSQSHTRTWGRNLRQTSLCHLIIFPFPITSSRNRPFFGGKKEPFISVVCHKCLVSSSLEIDCFENVFRSEKEETSQTSNLLFDLETSRETIRRKEGTSLFDTSHHTASDKSLGAMNQFPSRHFNVQSGSRCRRKVWWT